MKRQRLDGNANSAPAQSSLPPKAEVGLPPELWAHVLQFAYFDEVLACTAVNIFFLNDVTGQLKTLRVRSGESMDVSSSIVKRFTSVEDVYIYLIRDFHGRYHLDCAALRNAVPFLSNLPQLKYCKVGRKYDGPRSLSEYVVMKNLDNPKAFELWATFISSVCRAYKAGDLAQHVEFAGLVPYVSDYHSCLWKDNIPTLSYYRDDVGCQICDMICTSFPPVQVLTLNHEHIPCVTLQNIARIVRFRDENQAQSTMTKALMYEFENVVDEKPYMCPPDYVTKQCKAMFLTEDYFELKLMEEYILHGANPKDPAFLGLLLDKKRVSNAKESFIGQKRIVRLDTYNKLKAMGFDMSETNFVTVDETDNRTSIKQFEVRKIKNQLESGMAISKIESIHNRIYKRVTRTGRGIVVNGSLSFDDIVEELQEWLGMSLYKYRDAIKSIVMGYKAEWSTEIDQDSMVD